MALYSTPSTQLFRWMNFYNEIFLGVPKLSIKLAPSYANVFNKNNKELLVKTIQAYEALLRAKSKDVSLKKGS